MKNPVITQGSITLKKEFTVGKLVSMLFPRECMNHVQIDSTHEGEYTVSFKGMRDFCDQAVYHFLVYIERYTLGGEIWYVDKDFDVWRHFFDPEKKKWVEQEASCKFDSPGNIISGFLDDYLTKSEITRAPWGKCEDWEIGAYEY